MPGPRSRRKTASLPEHACSGPGRWENRARPLGEGTKLAKKRYPWRTRELLWIERIFGVGATVLAWPSIGKKPRDPAIEARLKCES